MMLSLPPTALLCLGRTSKSNKALTDDHRRRHFKFHRAVQSVVRPDEEMEYESLQETLDDTGSFIWGVAAYEFFARESLEGPTHADVDIVVQYGNLWRIISWVEAEIGDPDFRYDAEYDKDCPTLQSAMFWIGKHAPERRQGEKEALVKVLRFQRRMGQQREGGLRLIVTRRAPFELLLRADNSESSAHHSL